MQGFENPPFLLLLAIAVDWRSYKLELTHKKMIWQIIFLASSWTDISALLRRHEIESKTAGRNLFSVRKLYLDWPVTARYYQINVRNWNDSVGTVPARRKSHLSLNRTFTFTIALYIFYSPLKISLQPCNLAHFAIQNDSNATSLETNYYSS